METKLKSKVRSKKQFSSNPKPSSMLLIQIPKISFFDDDPYAIEKAFRDKLAKVMGKKPCPFFDNFGTLVKINLCKGSNQRMILFEQPLYSEIISRVKKMKQENTLKESFDIDDLSLLSGVEIKKPISDDCYSFYVYSGRKSSVVGGICSVSNLWSMTQTATKYAQNIIKNDYSKTMDHLFLIRDVEMNNSLMQILRQLFEGEPVSKHKINSLEQLANVFK